MEYLVITIAEQQVTAARFEVSARTASLAGAASFPLESAGGLPGVAATIAAGVSGTPRVIVCLPPALFAQRTIELPLKDLRKVREVLPAHLQGEIALQAEEAVFDALPAADGSYLALWARRSEIAHVVDIFTQAGCEPQIVSSAPFAWGSLPGIPDSCAITDGSALTVVEQGRLSFMRAIQGEKPVRQVGATLAALELSGNVLPRRLTVFGEQAQALAVVETPLEVGQLELSAELAPVFRNEQTFQQLAGLFAVACADHAGLLPDFRRGDLAWTSGDALLRRKLRLTALLAVVVAALLFVSKGLQYRAARADIASLNSSISSIYRDIFPGRSRAVDELSEVRGEIRKLSGTDSTGAVLDLLKQLADLKGSTINGLFEAELEGRILRVKGDARSAQAVNEFKSALSGLLSSIELGEIKSRPDGSVGFSLSGTIREVAR